MRYSRPATSEAGRRSGRGDSAACYHALNANTLDVPIPLLIVVALLAAASVDCCVGSLAQAPRNSADPELAGIPLVVNDVVKTYGDGFRAVDGVSFRAKAGQVVGLLGPNGAGKTTVIRMLLGLIRPNSGSIYVNGQPVHAGADVLSSVGALIEGPASCRISAAWRT